MRDLHRLVGDPRRHSFQRQIRRRFRHCCPYWPDVAGAPQNTIIGGATLWVLRGRPSEEYRGVAKFFAYLSKPEVQAAWHQNTGYLPVTRAAYDLTRAQGFYDRNPGTAISIEQITLKLPTENSKGLRLGSFVLIRDVIEEELEQAFAGKKTAQAALSAAVERGNRLLQAVRARQSLRRGASIRRNRIGVALDN